MLMLREKYWSWSGEITFGIGLSKNYLIIYITAAIICLDSLNLSAIRHM